jgi:hypothetical protein
MTADRSELAAFRSQFRIRVHTSSCPISFPRSRLALSCAKATTLQLGVSGDMGRQMGLSDDWAHQVGNYREISKGDVGNTPFGLMRGQDAQWTDGGLNAVSLTAKLTGDLQ